MRADFYVLCGFVSVVDFVWLKNFMDFKNYLERYRC